MAIFLLISGLVFGSFLNVLIWRLNTSTAPKFWQGRSICPECKHQLAWKDNVPLLSFIFLRGKCRYCRKKISWQYPIVELITAIVFAMTGFHPVILLLGCVFIVIFFSDLIYGLIPDEMIILGTLVGLGNQHLLVGLLVALPFLVFAKLKWMGYGDATLAFLIGHLLGWPKIIVALWMAFVIGGGVTLMLLALRRTKFSATIPLGPFLVLGTIISALWFDRLLAIL